MAKLKITPGFRKIFADKIMDLGNFATVALVFGQFVGGDEVSSKFVFIGVLFTVICYIIAYVIGD